MAKHDPDVLGVFQTVLLPNARGWLFFKVSPFLLSCTEKTSSAEADEWELCTVKVVDCFVFTIIE